MVQVAQILIASGSTFATEGVAQANLLFGGLAGDRHFGLTRPSCSRTPWHPRGTSIANTRQISIVSMEECQVIAEALGIAELEPRWLGANFALRHVPALSKVKPSTRLVFPSGATLFITEENVPCRQPARILASAYARPDLTNDFVKKALGLRGVVALVEREGTVHVKDTVRIIKPREAPSA